MNRAASIYNPDNNLDGVVPQDIANECIEARHLGKDEVLASKVGVVDANGLAPLIAITKDVTTGATSVTIFNANAPFAFEVIDVIVQPRGASTNGTMKVTDGTNDITDAMICAVDKTMVKAATIDNAYSSIALGGSLKIVCAGDAVANTIGLVTVIAVKK